MKKELETINMKVLSYCDIPQELTEDHWMSENTPDSFIKFEVTSKKEQPNFNDDFAVDNWIIENYPELGRR